MAKAPSSTTRKHKGGPRTPFGPKHLPNRSHSLTELGKKVLAAAANRADTSESNVVELLVRRHAGTVRREDFTEAAST